MRSAIFAALALGATAVFNGAPAHAGELPFCMKGQGIDQAHGDCSYYTYEQCLMTASGRLNYCDTNPFYYGAASPQPRPRTRKPRHHRYRG